MGKNSLGKKPPKIALYNKNKTSNNNKMQKKQEIQQLFLEFTGLKYNISQKKRYNSSLEAERKHDRKQK